MTLCVLPHLPPFVRLKMGTIYPGPKAAIRFHYCKNLLKLMPTYSAELLCIINRMWPKEKRKEEEAIFQRLSFPSFPRRIRQSRSKLPKCLD